MLVIDNFNGRELQSETLCTVLTDRPAMVRVLGVSDLKEANPRMLISIAGNGYTFAEDLVRRNFVIELDAKLENPELRKFAGNFLAGIAQQRPQLLQAALTIWRYGRQQVKSNSRPLGGYEQWSAWVRDPLVALGCEDPVSVAKITKHKTSDPTRLETVEILQAWWEHHGKDEVTANELHEAVKALLVPDAKKRSRQAVASLVAKLDGTRLAGFHLTSDKDDENRGRWTAVSYRLEWVKDESEQTTDATPAGEVRTDGRKPTDDPAPALTPTPAWVEQLHIQGLSQEEIADLTLEQARDIILAALGTVLAEWKKAIGVGQTSLDHVIKMAADHPSLKAALVTVAPMDDGQTISNVRLARWLRNFNEVPVGGLQLSGGGVDKTGSPLWTLQSLPSKPLHPELEPEAAAGSSEEDDAQFNREPDDAAVRPEPAAPEASSDAGGFAFMITNAMKQQLRSRGFSDAQIANLTPQQAHDILDDQKRAFEEARQELEEEAPGNPKPKASLRILTPMPMPDAPPEPKPSPTDPVERWRTCFARLDPARDPCAGFRTGEWPRMHSVIRTFLACPFAKHAADAGWTEPELVGVDPEVGVARPNACGALMTNAYGSPVTQVTPQLIRFANGLAVYKARLSVGNSVAVWD